LPIGKDVKDVQAWSVTKISLEQQDFFFQLLVATLGAIDKIGEDREFIGKHHWGTLLNDSSFKAKLQSDRWESNLRFKNNMGRAYLHYADTKGDLETAENYFRTAHTLATNVKDENVVSSANFYIGMIEFINGRAKSAANKINQIIKWNRITAPLSVYQPRDLISGADWNVFNRLWSRFRTGEFEPQLVKLMKMVGQEHAAADAELKMAQMDFFDTPNRRKGFLTVAQAQYARLVQAWKTKDQDALQEVLTDGAYYQMTQLTKPELLESDDIYSAASFCSFQFNLQPQTDSYITVIFVQGERKESAGSTDDEIEKKVHITFAGNNSGGWKIYLIEGPQSTFCQF
jgi:hypothetical protein